MPQDIQPATDVPFVDTSDLPLTMDGVTPPTIPAMVDDDAEGEINGVSTEDLSVQGGE